MGTNEERQRDEMEAMSAIFGEDFELLPDQSTCRVTIRAPNADVASSSPGVALAFYLPPEYPSLSAPEVEVLETPWLGPSDRSMLQTEIYSEFSKLRSSTEGEGSEADVMLFHITEYVKDRDWLWAKEAAFRSDQQLMMKKLEEQQAALPQKNEEQRSRHRKPTAQRPAGDADDADAVGPTAVLDDLDMALGIRHGAPFTVRKSVFQAHIAPVKSMEDVEAVMDTLLLNRKVAAATHNIMAYRFVSENAQRQETIHQDYDDDGESAAGGRLLQMLQSMGATDVVVVVSRWFGGILLGPERFRHINNTGRELLVQWGYGEKQGQGKRK